MAVVTALYGAAYDGKNEEAFQRCLSYLQAHNGQSCLYLARGDARARQLRQRALRETGGGFLLPISTLSALLRQWHQKLPGRRRLLGGLEQKLLLEDLLRRHASEFGEALYLRHVREHPGLVAKLLEFIVDIRRIGLHDAERLAERFQHCRGRQRKVYQELAALLRLYNGKLAEAHLTDHPGIFLTAADCASAGTFDIRGVVPSPELLVLEGYYELPAPDQQVVLALFAQFEQTIFTLDMPHNPYNWPKDERCAKAFRVLREVCEFLQRSGCSVRLYAPQRRLFASEQAEPQEQPAALLHRPPDSVVIRSAQDRNAEIVWIAASIRTLYRDRHVAAFGDIGVVFPKLEPYAPLIREIFPRYGIPLTMFDGNPLASSPVATAIFRLMQVVLDDYSYDALRACFVSPLIEVDGTPPLDSASYPALDMLLRSFGVTQGKAAWLEQIAAYRQQVETAFAQDERGAAAVYPVEYALLPALLNFFDLLAPFDAPEPRSAVETLHALGALIHRLHIPERILHAPNRAIREQECAALQRFLNLLNLLRQELRKSAETRAEMTLRDLFDLLQLTAQNETYYVRQEFDDAVFVMTAQDARQTSFRHLFFGGLAEKDFPGQEDASIFLSEQDAQIVGLPTFADKLKQSAYLFYLTIHNPTDRLYLSYPRQEDESDLLPSSYIERVKAELPNPTAMNRFEVGQRNDICPERAGEYSQGIHPLEKDAAVRPNMLDSGDESPAYIPLPFQGASSDALPEDKSSGFMPAPFQGMEADFPLAQCYTFSELAEWIGKRLNSDEPPQVIRAALETLRQQRGGMAVAHLLNGITHEARRRGMALSEFDGMLSATWTKSLLKNRYGQHVYHATEFDVYVRCPMKFMFQRILQLATLPPTGQEFSAQTVGSLVHAILFRFYAGETAAVDEAFLRRAAQPEAWQIEARQRIADALRAELAQHDFSGAFWDMVVFGLSAGLPGFSDDEAETDAQGVLSKFVAQESGRLNAARPRYLDAAFGMRDARSSLSDAPYTLRGLDANGNEQQIKLMGKIDRIDADAGNGGAVRPKAALVDYKTGGVPLMKEIKHYQQFQLPLHLLALRELFGDTLDVIGGAYYQVKSPHEFGLKSPLASQEEHRYFPGASAKSFFESSEELLALLQNYANHAVQCHAQIQDGQFHPTMLGETAAKCEWCDYRRICRVDHQRMANREEK